MQIFEYTDLDKEEVMDFIHDASLCIDDPAHVNMRTLPDLLYGDDKRFSGDNGTYYLLKINDKIAIGSGVYVSKFDPYVALGGVRSWVNEEHRGKFLLGGTILPKHLEWSKAMGMKTLALTFNEYNKHLIRNFGKTGLGTPRRRPEGAIFHGSDPHIVPFPVEIQYTQQWVLYRKIDENYEPNWQSIRWLDK